MKLEPAAVHMITRTLSFPRRLRIVLNGKDISSLKKGKPLTLVLDKETDVAITISMDGGK